MSNVNVNLSENADTADNPRGETRQLALYREPIVGNPNPIPHQNPNQASRHANSRPFQPIQPNQHQALKAIPMPINSGGAFLSPNGDVGLAHAPQTLTIPHAALDAITAHVNTMVSKVASRASQAVLEGALKDLEARTNAIIEETSKASQRLLEHVDP